MTAVEQPCYTLINASSDSEPYNEMHLKSDLGKVILALIIFQKERNALLAKEHCFCPLTLPHTF